MVSSQLTGCFGWPFQAALIWSGLFSFEFLVTTCTKKNVILLWFTFFLSKPEMILPLMIPSYNFTRHTKKTTLLLGVP
jgi:hypothetical protein